MAGTNTKQRSRGDNESSPSSNARSTGKPSGLEEHDDPAHPVVALAKRRIVELTAERDQLFDIEVTYNKHERKLQLAATLELETPLEQRDRLVGGRTVAPMSIAARS